MQPKKPVRSNVRPAVMTDCYITNYEGICYFTNLEHSMHLVIEYRWSYACDSHTLGPTVTWKRTSAVLGQREISRKQPRSGTNISYMILLPVFQISISDISLETLNLSRRAKFHVHSLHSLGRASSILPEQQETSVCKADSEPGFPELQLCKSRFWWVLVF